MNAPKMPMHLHRIGKYIYKVDFGATAANAHFVRSADL